MIDETQIFNELIFRASEIGEENRDLLSEIVNQVNHLYGVDLSSDDLSEIVDIEEALALDA